MAKSLTNLAYIYAKIMSKISWQCGQNMPFTRGLDKSLNICYMWSKMEHYGELWRTLNYSY